MATIGRQLIVHFSLASTRHVLQPCKEVVSNDVVGALAKRGCNEPVGGVSKVTEDGYRGIPLQRLIVYSRTKGTKDGRVTPIFNSELKEPNGGGLVAGNRSVTQSSGYSVRAMEREKREISKGEPSCIVFKTQLEKGLMATDLGSGVSI